MFVLQPSGKVPATRGRYFDAHLLLGSLQVGGSMDACVLQFCGAVYCASDKKEEVRGGEPEWGGGCGPQTDIHPGSHSRQMSQRTD